MRLVQTTGKKQSDASASPMAHTFAANMVPGNTVILAGNHFAVSAHITGITIGGGTAVQDVERTDTTTALNRAEIWRAVVTTANDDISIAGDVGNNYVSFSAEEWRGFLHDSPLDETGSTGNTTDSTPSATAGGAVDQADELVYAVFTDYIGTNWTSSAPPAGAVETYEETDGTTHEAGSAAYKIIEAIETPTMEFTTGASMSHVVALATYKIYGGAHHFAVDFLGTSGANVTTAGVTTKATGSSFLTLVGRGVFSDFGSATMTDSKSNGYTLLDSNTYTDWPTSGTGVYHSLDGVGGSSHTFTTSKPTDDDEVTLLAVEVPGGYTEIVDWAWNEDLTSPDVSDTVTTTGDAWLVAFWAGDDSNGELNPSPETGWYKLEWTSSLASNHVQMAAFAKFVGAGTHSITVTPSTSQGAQLYLIALQAPDEEESAGTLAGMFWGGRRAA